MPQLSLRSLTFAVAFSLCMLIMAPAGYAKTAATGPTLPPAPWCGLATGPTLPPAPWCGIV
jgi:hypothetical protein